MSVYTRDKAGNIDCWNTVPGTLHDPAKYIFIDPEGETDAEPLCQSCFDVAMDELTKSDLDPVQDGPIVRRIDDPKALVYLGFDNGAG